MQAQHRIKRTLSQPQALARVYALQATMPQAHRTALADRVCAAFDFIDARGRPQRAGCLKALRTLEHEGAMTLPAPRSAPGPRRARRLEAPVTPAQAVPGQVSELVGLELILVEDADQRALWNELMAREHPRGMGPLVGCQLRYLIGSAHGWLGAIGIGAAALQLAPRDRWIGWDGDGRSEQLHRLVGLNRFLIRPDVHCHNLASHVLGRLLRRLGSDFEARYGYRPWLVETFVDSARHTGASLRAANWQHIGDSGGRGRQDCDHAGAETAKAIYVYPLAADWRMRLGVGPAPSGDALALEPGQGLVALHWAEQEFGGAPLGDQRRSRRLVDSAQLQGEQPMRGFTGVRAANWPAVKGYYRLIDQPVDSEVTPDNILAPHRERTRQRMAAQATVLCIQDGTAVNFTTHGQTRGLGVTGTNQTGAQSRGLHLHSTFAVSGDGLPLGVLRARFAAPQPRDGDKPIAAEDKKSFYWIDSLRDCAAVANTLPDTQVINVADREADGYDLLAEQLRHPEVDLIVRAKANRRLPEGQGRLFDAVRATQPRATIEVELNRRSQRDKTSKRPACAGRTQRTATLTLRYRQVTLARNRTNNPEAPATLTVTIVHAVEATPPAGAKPIEWFVLTTLAVDSPEQAEQVLHYYTLRWRIEDWHRVLKSGCQIDKLGHHSAERLERAIAMRLVIAWRVMLMTLLGREVPDLPAELLFSDPELRVLGDVARSQGRSPPTNLGEAVIAAAMLGGYLNRNHDPPPGHQLMWQGYTILAAMGRAYQIRDEVEQ